MQALVGLVSRCGVRAAAAVAADKRGSPVKGLCCLFHGQMTPYTTTICPLTACRDAYLPAYCTLAPQRSAQPDGQPGTQPFPAPLSPPSKNSVFAGMIASNDVSRPVVD